RVGRRHPTPRKDGAPAHSRESVMNAFRFVMVGAVLLCRVPGATAQEDLPPAAQEVLKQFEQEAVEIDKKLDEQLRKAREKVAVELKKVQDQFCKEAKLDEAVAVRDLIRGLQAGLKGPLGGGDLPAAAREVHKQYEDDAAALHGKAEAEFKKA